MYLLCRRASRTWSSLIVVMALMVATIGVCESRAQNADQPLAQAQSGVAGLSSSGCPEPSAELFELQNDDRELRDYVQQHIKSDFSKFENIDEANRFFDRLRLLFRRYMINTAYARNELRDLHEFLGQESTIQLVRFDNRPFVESINDERLDKLQVYAQESDLARKIYSKFIKKLIDIRNEQAAKKARGSDGAGVAREPPSFWANVWCKISNNCN